MNLASGAYVFSGLQTAVKRDSDGNYLPDEDVNQGGIKFTFDHSGASAKFGIALPGIASDPLANFLSDEHLGTSTSQFGMRTYHDISRYDSRPGYFTWAQYSSSTPDPEAPSQSSDLAYTYLGTWSESEAGVFIDRRGFYVAGFQTPVAEVPKSGTATYAGVGTVQGQVFAGPVGYVNIVGDSSLVANFGAGTLTGSFTNMKASSAISTDAWNSVSVVASISGNGFSGTTSADPHSGGYSLGASSGNIQGGFYGPNAREIGAIWTLSDGANAAVGVVGAKRTTMP